MTRPPIVVRTSRIVAVLVALLAAMALSACAATGPSWDTASDGPVYLMDNTTATQVPSGTRMDWNSMHGIVLMAAPAPADLSNLTPVTFPAPTSGANDCIAFLSPVGSERTKTAWKSWDDPVPLGGKGALLPAVWPGYLGNGNAAGAKSAGGTYSLGIAYLTNNDQTVVKAYYTTITVDAGSGTWRFATPTSAAATAPATS